MGSDLHHILYIGEANPGGEPSAEPKAGIARGKRGEFWYLENFNRFSAERARRPLAVGLGRPPARAAALLWHSGKFSRKIFFQKMAAMAFFFKIPSETSNFSEIFSPPILAVGAPEMPFLVLREF